MSNCNDEFIEAITTTIETPITNKYFNTTYKIALLKASTNLILSNHITSLPVIQLSFKFLVEYLSFLEKGNNNQRTQRTLNCPKIYLDIREYLDLTNSTLDELSSLCKSIDLGNNLTLSPHFVSLLKQIRSNVLLKQPFQYFDTHFQLCLNDVGGQFRPTSHHFDEIIGAEVKSLETDPVSYSRILR